MDDSNKIDTGGGPFIMEWTLIGNRSKGGNDDNFTNKNSGD